MEKPPFNQSVTGALCCDYLHMLHIRVNPISSARRASTIWQVIKNRLETCLWGRGGHARMLIHVHTHAYMHRWRLKQDVHSHKCWLLSLSWAAFTLWGLEEGGRFHFSRNPLKHIPMHLGKESKFIFFEFFSSWYQTSRHMLWSLKLKTFASFSFYSARLEDDVSP